MLLFFVSVVVTLMVILVLYSYSRDVDGEFDADAAGGGEFRLHGTEGRAAARGVRLRVRATVGGAAEGRQAHHQRPGRDRPKPGKSRIHILRCFVGSACHRSSHMKTSSQIVSLGFAGKQEAPKPLSCPLSIDSK